MTDIVKAMTLLQSPWFFILSAILVYSVVSLPHGVTAAPKIAIHSRSSGTNDTLPDTPVSTVQLLDSVVNLTNTVGEPEYKLLVFCGLGDADKMFPNPASHRGLSLPKRFGLSISLSPIWMSGCYSMVIFVWSTRTIRKWDKPFRRPSYSPVTPADTVNSWNHEIMSGHKHGTAQSWLLMWKSLNLNRRKNLLIRRLG